MSAGIPAAPWQSIGAHITDANGHYIAMIAPTSQGSAARLLIRNAPALLRFAEEQFAMLPEGADRDAVGLLITQAGGLID